MRCGSRWHQGGERGAGTLHTRKRRGRDRVLYATSSSWDFSTNLLNTTTYTQPYVPLICYIQAAAVGVPSSGGGPEHLVLVLVLRHQQQRQQQEQVVQSQQLRDACQSAIRARLNPLFRVSAVEVRTTLPRNASNKVMRRVLRDEVLLGAAAAKQHQRSAPSSKM
eukprot:1155208-Pelagomonas_calceolata.AAC.2